ncbi:hypothetical protein BB559_000088 [Furculomyces boomerangus]|uniref:Uncharacterized protein n=1 Tax=Furculomyces boomerangus TaxID=61424 RepID=A0A2T9Z6H9_9FUNG|nr:hypothetical protein BB559_000088 [Furculomyces boomerangus]
MFSKKQSSAFSHSRASTNLHFQISNQISTNYPKKPSNLFVFGDSDSSIQSERLKYRKNRFGKSKDSTKYNGSDRINEKTNIKDSDNEIKSRIDPNNYEDRFDIDYENDFKDNDTGLCDDVIAKLNVIGLDYFSIVTKGAYIDKRRKVAIDFDFNFDEHETFANNRTPQMK